MILEYKIYNEKGEEHYNTYEYEIVVDNVLIREYIMYEFGYQFKYEIIKDKESALKMVELLDINDYLIDITEDERFIEWCKDRFLDDANNEFDGEDEGLSLYERYDEEW